MNETERKAARRWAWGADDNEERPLLARVEQVGGDHYQPTVEGLGHWDIIEIFDVAYLEATATKYVTRAGKKGSGAEDLKKAISYLQKMNGRPARRTVPWTMLDQFAKANQLDTLARVVIFLILSDVHGQPRDIVQAIQIMETMIADGLV